MYFQNRVFSGAFKLLIAVTGLAGLLLSMGVLEGQLDFTAFRYYTNLSNLLCVLYFFISGLWVLRGHTEGRTTWQPVLKGVVTMGITVTMLVAHFLLGQLFDQVSAVYQFSLVLLHYVVPVLTLLDWALFDRKGQIKPSHPLLWLVFPLVYLGWVEVYALFNQGVFMGSRFPYPFLDVDQFGVRTVVLTVVVLVLAFTALGYLFYWIDHMLGKKGRSTQKKYDVKNADTE